MKTLVTQHFDSCHAFQTLTQTQSIYTQICRHTYEDERTNEYAEPLWMLIIQRTSSFTLRENGPASSCHVWPSHSVCKNVVLPLEPIDCAHSESLQHTFPHENQIEKPVWRVWHVDSRAFVQWTFSCIGGLNRAFVWRGMCVCLCASMCLCLPLSVFTHVWPCSPSKRGECICISLPMWSIYAYIAFINKIKSVKTL